MVDTSDWLAPDNGTGFRRAARAGFSWERSAGPGHRSDFDNPDHVKHSITS